MGAPDAVVMLTVAPAAAQAGPSTFVTDLGSPYPTGSNSYGVVATDLNADGAPDLAVVNGTSSDLSVYLRSPPAADSSRSGAPRSPGLCRPELRRGRDVIPRPTRGPTSPVRELRQRHRLGADPQRERRLLR